MTLKPKVRKWMWFLAVAGLLIAAKIFFGGAQPDSEIQIIRSVKVTKGDLKVTVDATGSVKPYNRVEIKSPIAGRVEEVLVQEGDSVHQGQILAWLSSTDRAALLDTARAQGVEAYKKWQDSYKPVPLMAPLDGMVIVRGVEPGQTVTPTDPVIVISDRLIVEALVDETDLARIELAQKVDLFLDAYPAVKISGKVDHLSYESQLINNVNVYAVDVIPENIPANFRSGMTANLTFLVARHPDVLLLPSEAVAEWPKKSLPKPGASAFAVYLKKSGRLVPEPVTIGETDGRMTEITSGLTEGLEIQIIRKKQAQTGSAFSPMGQRPNGGGGGQQQRRGQ